MIGFAGQKQSGKSTAAAALVDADFKALSFATPLKWAIDGLLLALGLSRSDIAVYAVDKEFVIPQAGRSYRYMCQRFGDVGREFKDDFWVDCARAILLQCTDVDVVFDDVRFDNEADMIRQQGGLIIHVRRPSLLSTDDHISEAGIQVKPGDLWLCNIGSVDDLQAKLWRVLDARLGNVG